jgi:hypothetical protein
MKFYRKIKKKLTNTSVIFKTFKPFQLKNYHYKYYTNGSAFSLRLIFSSIKKQKQSFNVLIPYLFCGQTFKKIQLENVNFYFYDLNVDLSPNYVFIENRFSNINFDCFVLVHYFGKLIKSSQERAKRYCSSKNMFLIEDCAHILNTEKNDTWVGDFLIFSPHKFINIPNLGILYSKNEKLNIIEIQEKLPFNWLVKRFLKYISPIILLNNKQKFISSFHDLEIKTPNLLLINYVNKKMYYLNNFSFKLFLTEFIFLLKTKDKWIPIYEDVNIIPHIFGMICDNEEVAAYRYNFLNKKYKLVMRWPDDIDFQNENFLNFKFKKFQNNTLFFIIDLQYDYTFYLNNIKKIILDPEFY